MTVEEPLQSCPFCGFESPEYALLLHLETKHAEGDSPFVVKDDSADADSVEEEEEPRYAKCPIEGCTEVLLEREMDDHVDFHAQEEDLDTATAADEASTERRPLPAAEPAPAAPSSSRRAEAEAERKQHNRTPVSSEQAQEIRSWRKLLSGSHRRSKHSTADSTLSASSSQPVRKKRLGKAELGKYAHEERMPSWLVELLKRGWGIKASGVIPVLEQLLQQSASTQYAYLCNPCVQHVSKLKREGGFCGYRNIQMMASYVIGAQSQGAHHFRRQIPSIFDIQDFIEAAWDNGVNAQGRLETGGVKGTRKYIGTPEAQALLVNLDIPCDAQGFKDKEAGRSEMRLLREVEKYFESGVRDPRDKVRGTAMPPIYFQHPGHSMTIVGIERLYSGQLNLLVFDPMFRDASSLTRLINHVFDHTRVDPQMLLKPYRRGNRYLKKYREFELLKLKPPLEV